MPEAEHRAECRSPSSLLSLWAAVLLKRWGLSGLLVRGMLMAGPPAFLALLLSYLQPGFAGNEYMDAFLLLIVQILAPLSGTLLAGTAFVGWATIKSIERELGPILYDSLRRAFALCALGRAERSLEKGDTRGALLLLLLASEVLGVDPIRVSISGDARKVRFRTDLKNALLSFFGLLAVMLLAPTYLLSPTAEEIPALRPLLATIAVGLAIAPTYIIGFTELEPSSLLGYFLLFSPSDAKEEDIMADISRLRAIALEDETAKAILSAVEQGS